MSPDGSGDHLFALLNGPTGGISFSSDGTMVAVIDHTTHGDRIMLLGLVNDTRSVVLRARKAPTEVLSSLALSPHARRVAFSDGSYPRHLFTVRVDGSHLTKIANGFGDADWGANGRIVASDGIFDFDGKRFIATMDPDGGNRTVIATFPRIKSSWGSVYELVPSWAAQRHRIHPDIWSVNTDGSSLRRLTRTPGASESGATFSPGGNSLVFSKQKKASTTSNLWTMDIDGGNKTQLTSTAHRDEYPLAWRPA
jgi:hypothetical protein